MTNDTYISGLCRINKHAEQLSILRGIDRCGPTSAEKHLVALFSAGEGGRGWGWGGDQCTQFQITINHPAMSTIKKLLLELQHPENVSFSKHGTKAERRRIQAGPAEVGRGVIMTGAPACVYMAVVWCV